MGTVERIFSGHLYLVPDFFRFIVRAAIADSPRDEIGLERSHQIRLLLADGFSQQVGFAEVKAAECVGYGHELLLIAHYSERVLRRFVTAVVIDRRHFPPPETDIILRGPDVERGGTVQGVDGDQVLYALWPHILNEAGDAG